MRCDQCGTELPDKSRSCSLCGYEVQDAPAARVPDGALRCGNCGVINAKGMTNCGSCGADLDPRIVKTYAEPPPPGRLTAGPVKPGPSNMLNIASMLLIVAGILGLIVVGLHLSEMSELEDYEGSGLPSGMTDFLDAVNDLSVCVAAMISVANVVSLLTGFVLRTPKRKFGLCLAGAGLAMMSIGPFFISSLLAFVALLFIAISADEF